MGKDISMAPGDFLKGTKKVFNNRTGATTVKGGIAFVDTPSADTDSGTDDILAQLSNAVATSTALITKSIMIVWAKGGTADNGAEEAYVGDMVYVPDLLVDSTTDVVIGDILKPVNAGDHMVVATAATDRWFASALKGRTTNDEGTVPAIIYSSGRF